MGKPTVVVLLSGGMDSCVTAAAVAEDYELALLHVSYGQRTAARELRAFRDIADFFNTDRRLALMAPELGIIGGSSLTDAAIPVPETEIASSGIPSTYVPFRNAHLLSLAVSWAEVIGAKAVAIGAVEEDSSGYPDCRRVFYEAFERVIDTGTRPETDIALLVPVIGLSKAEIVRRGIDLGAPLHLTWSCYRSEDVPCGTCESCLLRQRAFAEAGIPDPLIV